MVKYLLEFHKKIRFSKTLTEYQEQPYPLSYFLIHPKKLCNICKIFMEQSENIFIFNIPGTLIRNIPRNFIGNLFHIFWEYIMRMFHEYSLNIYLPGGIDVLNNLFALNSQFNPQYIYYVSQTLWLLLSRSSSHVITNKI